MYLIKNIYISQQLESPEIFYWIPVWTLTHVDSALFFIKNELFFYSWNLQVRYENYKSDKKRSKDKKSL